MWPFFKISMRDFPKLQFVYTQKSDLFMLYDAANYILLGRNQFFLKEMKILVHCTDRHT